MYLMHMDFTGVTRKNLSEQMQNKVRDWREGVLDPRPDTKYGLWIFGDRRAGTSYAAQAAAGDLAFNHNRGYAEHVTAASLVRQLRALWDITTRTRQHGDDYALYLEAQNAEQTLERYFFVDELLWIDDLHDETIDWNIWRKHVQPLVEERVKAQKPTIISTTLAPDDGAIPENVITGLFVTACCTGYRP
jgi:hypothetical protein